MNINTTDVFIDMKNFPPLFPPRLAAKEDEYRRRAFLVLRLPACHDENNRS